MPRDITVDTNVLMHADNPRESRSDGARKFATALLAGKESICIDTGFHPDSAKNRSRIGHEYLTHLIVGSLGYVVVTTLALNERVSIVSTDVHQHSLKEINRTVADKTDRVFVRVAMNSSDRLLASHDFQAFSVAVRRKLGREFGVTILEAMDCVECLAGGGAEELTSHANSGETGSGRA